jgi:uncharacterized protein (DUF1919 family)
MLHNKCANAIMRAEKKNTLNKNNFRMAIHTRHNTLHKSIIGTAIKNKVLLTKIAVKKWKKNVFIPHTFVIVSNDTSSNITASLNAFSKPTIKITKSQAPIAR